MRGIEDRGRMKTSALIAVLLLVPQISSGIDTASPLIAQGGNGSEHHEADHRSATGMKIA